MGVKAKYTPTMTKFGISWMFLWVFMDVLQCSCFVHTKNKKFGILIQKIQPLDLA